MYISEDPTFGMMPGEVDAYRDMAIKRAEAEAAAGSVTEAQVATGFLGRWAARRHARREETLQLVANTDQMLPPEPDGPEAA